MRPKPQAQRLRKLVYYPRWLNNHSSGVPLLGEKLEMILGKSMVAITHFTRKMQRAHSRLDVTSIKILLLYVKVQGLKSSAREMSVAA